MLEARCAISLEQEARITDSFKIQRLRRETHELRDEWYRRSKRMHEQKGARIQSQQTLLVSKYIVRVSGHSTFLHI